MFQLAHYADFALFKVAHIACVNILKIMGLER